MSSHGLRLCVVVLLSITACVGSNDDQQSNTRAQTSTARAVFTPTPPAPAGPPEGWFKEACKLPIDQLRRLRRGYFPGRSPDITIVSREPDFFGGFIGQSHAGPWDYVQGVPLVFYGPGFIKSKGPVGVDRDVTVADIAPTQAELLGTEFPTDVGRPLTEVLAPDRDGPPKVIVTVVWDGGGNNVLDAWPGKTPNLHRMMREGASVRGVTSGSSPSITPPVHSTIGTGRFPNEHGVTGIPLRVDSEVKLAFKGKSPEDLLTPTLADVYDRSVGNAAEVGLIAFWDYHLGMMGHGAFLDGGDKDVAAFIDSRERLVTNESYFEIPSYLHEVPGLDKAIREVDLDDGRLDSKWMGDEVLSKSKDRRPTPVTTLWQTELIKALLDNEGYGQDDVPDLFFTNFKQPDDVGHTWNMLYPHMGPTLRYVDSALGEIENWLNENVGKKEWVMVVTADHGQAPLAEDARAWPISLAGLLFDLEEHFGVSSEELFAEPNSFGFWMQEGYESSGVTMGEISNWLLDYRIGDNAGKIRPLLDQYKDRQNERVISAAFPTTALDRIWRCARSGQR
jgi:hypothetical protein